MNNYFKLNVRFVLTFLIVLTLATCGGGGSETGHTISGFVDLDGGSGLSGVTVTLTGSPPVNRVTDTSGNYEFNNLSDGSYVITPSLDGHTFFPLSRAVSVSGGGVGGVDFSATFTGFKISGSFILNGIGFSGATITLSGDASDTTVTNSSGIYEFNGLSDGSYVVVPNPKGYTFSLPLDTNVSISGANVGAVNFNLTNPKNVILFIGDGMGFEHVKATGIYWNGTAGTLNFESLANFPNQAIMTTSEFSGGVTDSAASVTAMATGEKVSNRVISMRIPGDGSPLKTRLEYMKELGKSTGLVTTSFISDATPAGFGAHEPDRGFFSNIVNDYLFDSTPNVLFGGAQTITPSAAQSVGYTVVLNRSEMQALDTETATLVSGQFGNSYMPFELDGLGSLPHLWEMTSTALNILDNDPDGFFLLVENELIDNASHFNDIERAIYEVFELSNAVQVALDWAAGRNDTLIIVASDHETGGLTVLQNNGQFQLPDVSWFAPDPTGHTNVTVPVYAWGVNADLVGGVIDNTDIFNIISQMSTTGP